MRHVRVVAADPHPVVRAGLRALLHAHSGFELVGEAADGPGAYNLALGREADVLVLEVRLGDQAGAEVTTRVRESRPACRTLGLTACKDAAELRRLLEAGASGYVHKRAPAEEVVAAIRAVAAGGAYWDPALGNGALVVSPPKSGGTEGGLSAREEEILSQVARGHSNKEIAARMNLSVKTIEMYKARAMGKLKLRGRVGIVRHAIERGWLEFGGD